MKHLRAVTDNDDPEGFAEQLKELSWGDLADVLITSDDAGPELDVIAAEIRNRLETPHA